MVWGVPILCHVLIKFIQMFIQMFTRLLHFFVSKHGGMWNLHVADLALVETERMWFRADGGWP